MMRRPQKQGFEEVSQSNDFDMEDENQRLEEELQSKIHNLRMLTIDIGMSFTYT